jgi:hypothetical protein
MISLAREGEQEMLPFSSQEKGPGDEFEGRFVGPTNWRRTGWVRGVNGKTFCNVWPKPLALRTQPARRW